MFDKILSFLAAPPDTRDPQGDLRLAVAVLLIEAAHRDDTFDAKERAVIERLLTAKFALTAEECAGLMQAGEAASQNLTQLHPHVGVITEQMDEAERIRLMEMLWDVAYADGVLDPEEDLLIRRLGSLIHITDRDRVLARQRVLARLGK
jgi:uncharacterized tellurite resistance protein B-like protein